MSQQGGPNSDWADVEAVILAGGRSRRMGLDKARLVVDGQRLLLRLSRPLLELGLPVRLAVGDAARAVLAWDLGLEALPDAALGEGPLRGLEAALRRLERDWLLVWTCDAPALPLGALAALLARARAGQARAAVFATPVGPEPLLGFYSRRCLGELESYLAGGGRAAQGFLERTAGLVLPCRELGLEPEQLRSLNWPEDL